MSYIISLDNSMHGLLADADALRPLRANCGILYYIQVTGRGYVYINGPEQRVHLISGAATFNHSTIHPSYHLTDKYRVRIF